MNVTQTDIWSLVLMLVQSIAAIHGLENFVVVAVASDENDGVARFKRSAEIYGYNITWLKRSSPSTPFRSVEKIILIKQLLESRKSDADFVVFYADSYDGMFNSPPSYLNARFRALKNTNILFGAGIDCDGGRIPLENVGTSRCLNAGLFAGFAPALYQLMSDVDINVAPQRDQPQFNKFYNNISYRTAMKIELDHHNEVFQNMKDVRKELKIDFATDPHNPILRNTASGTRPSIFHGPGKYGRAELDFVANYIGRGWSPTDGCIACRELEMNRTTDNLPSIMIAVHVSTTADDLKLFNKALLQLSYPKNKIHLRVINSKKTTKSALALTSVTCMALKTSTVE